jgi:hypothetical protein
LVGAALLDAAATMAACTDAGLTPQHFGDADLAAVYAAARRVHERGETVDPVTVHEALAEAGAQQRIGLKYLNELAQSVPSARSAAAYAAIIRRHAARRSSITALRAAAQQIEGDQTLAEPQVAAIARDILEQVNLGTRPAALPFRALPVSLTHAARPDAHGSVWGVYVPEGLVTVLSGHGGVGKSLLAMQLLVCIATGRPLFGIATRRSRIAFFSAEDGADLLHQRLLWICECMGIDPGELEGWAHLLDATEGEPVLFHEVSMGGQRIGTTTGSYAELRRYVDRHEIEVLIVDNMSDAFDGNEIERAKVRAFMRSLPQLRTGRRLTVLLLAHVDKGTARGDRGGSESYSGSTAVHNSARSRIYLARDRDGQLRLEHQKRNIGGQPAEPLLLSWPDGQLPQLDRPVNGHVQALVDSALIRTLLRLIDHFTKHEQFVSTSMNSQDSASKLLAGEPGYPRDRKPAEVQALLRSAERDGLLQRHQYRNRDRKERERWELTDKGQRLVASVAPGAPGLS